MQRREQLGRWGGVGRAGLTLLAATTLGLVLSSCRPVPIQWNRWGLAGPLPPDYEARLEKKTAYISERLFNEFLSPQGLLLYRRPILPDPQTGLYYDLADQSCWSGYLLAGLVFEYCECPSPEAGSRLRRVIAGLELLEEVTGVPGLIARCVVPSSIAERVAHHPEDWRVSPTRPSYSYRSDVSKDQYSGYLLGLVAASQLLPPIPERDRARTLLLKVATNLMRSGFIIKNAEGEPTPFGNLKPRRWGFPIGVQAAIALSAVRSVQQLEPERFAEALRVSTEHDLESVSQFVDVAYNSLSPLHVEFLNIRNESNACMGSAAFCALALIEDEPEYLERLRDEYRRFLLSFRGEGNAFFYCVGEFLNVADVSERERSLKNLYYARASGYLEPRCPEIYEGIPRRFGRGRKGRRQVREPLPLCARAPSSFFWRSDPFRIDLRPPAEPTSTSSSIDLYVCYWAGRYCGGGASGRPQEVPSGSSRVRALDRLSFRLIITRGFTRIVSPNVCFSTSE